MLPNNIRIFQAIKMTGRIPIPWIQRTHEPGCSFEELDAWLIVVKIGADYGLSVNEASKDDRRFTLIFDVP